MQNIKVGDTVEVKINKYISGLYWSLLGKVIEIHPTIIVQRLQANRYEPTTYQGEDEYGVEFFGERYLEVKSVNKEIQRFLGFTKDQLILIEI